MAFKRYIHKHGKKLGPYYYENVRGKDGGVKTVYLGTNPNHHQKHRIRKPLFFLILVLILILLLGGSLFLLQNKSYLIKKVKTQEPDFEVDQILLKVLIKSSEFIDKQVRVMNTGSEPATINVEILGLSDIVNIDSTSFTIKPGQTKVVGLNFSSYVPEQKIEQQPGIYVGKLIVKSQTAAKEIPVVVEIETKNVLFDMNLNPVAIERRVKQGTDTTIEVRLFNLQSIQSANVDVEYFVKDTIGNTILTESETVVAKTQASFFKTISIPKNLKPGPYVFAAQAKFGNSVGTSSYLFEVIGPEAETEATFVQFCKNNLLCLGLSITTILLLFALTAYFYFFIGAYLYEKVTGLATLPRKRKEKEAETAKEEIELEEKKSILDKIKNKIDVWKGERDRKRAEKEKAEREEELQKLAEKEKAELKLKAPSNNIKKFYRVLDAAEKAVGKNNVSKVDKLYIKASDLYLNLPNQEKQDVYGKLMELYQQRHQLREGLKQEIEVEEKQKERQRFIEEKKQEESIKRIELERKRVEEGKRKEEELRKDFEFRQKELEKQKAEEAKRKLEDEKKRREEQERKLKELEAKKTEEEKRRKQLEEERRKLEEQRREEELRKQKELEKERELEAKKRFEEEEKRKEEQEIRQKELDKQRQQQIKAQKLERIKQLEEKISKNKEIAEQLSSEFKKLEAEKRNFSSNVNDIDARAKRIDNGILAKSSHNEELNSEKNSLFEKYKKQIDEIAKKQEADRISREAKIKELKQNIIAKQSAMGKELEDELSKLSLDKRKATEKWKRLELKAKLKLEEQAFEDEVKKFDTKAGDNRKEIEGSYKSSLEGINKKQNQLKNEIANLESQKRQVLLEKKNLPRDLQSKDNEIQRLRLRIEAIEKEQESLQAEISKLMPGLSKFNLNFLRNFVSSYREKAQKRSKEREEKKARTEAEKRRKEEELRKQKELEEKSRKIEEERKRKEEERRVKEEQKRKALEEKIRLKEEKKKKPEESSKDEEIEEKPGEKKAGIFEQFFKKKEEPGIEEIKKELEQEQIAPEKRQSVFGKLFGRKSKEEKQIPEEEIESISEKIEVKSKKAIPKSETEELEDAIRSLDLFKKIEEGKGSIKEEKRPSILGRLFGKKKAEEKPEEEKIIPQRVLEKPTAKIERKEKIEEEKPKIILTGKSKKFEKCHKTLNEAKEYISKNNLSKAKKVYIEARNLYITLDYQEKKDIYGELMDIYNKLK